LKNEGLCIKIELMKIKVLLLAVSALLILNLSSLYSQPVDQNQNESTLKYLYERYMTIGLEYLERKSYEEAKSEFEKAKFLFPELAESYINLAIIQIHRYDYEGAVEILKEAKKLMPTNYPKEDILLYNLGLAYYRQHLYEEAFDYFSQCLKVNPGLKEAATGLELCRQKIDRKPASVEIAYAQEESKPVVKSRYRQEIGKILDGFEKIPEADASSPATKLLEEASISFKNNQTEKAIDLIQQSIALDPKNPQAHYRLGVVYAYSNRFDEAASYFEQTIKYDPSFLKAYINLGGVYGKLEQYPQALKILNQALRLDKNNAKIYYNLGMVYAGMGKKRQARKHFEKARVLCQQNGDALLLQKIPKL